MHAAKFMALAAVLAAACTTPAPQSSAPAQPPAAAARSCADMGAATIAGAQVTGAEEIQPGWPFPPSALSFPFLPQAAQQPFCRITLTIEQEIKVEVWLPPNWNGRQLGVGNGGFAGGLAYQAMAMNLAQGYAVSSTDTGHVTPTNVFDTDWAPGRRDRLENFGYRAHHLMAAAARAVIAAFYGRAPHHAYFSGCSSGGWQGLTEAQRFPDDYDGVLAGAPANNFVLLQTNGVLGRQYALRNPAAALTPQKSQLIVDAAIAACDRIDGAADGLIENPRACMFNPETLLCRGADAPTCLTRAQVEFVRSTYGPRQSAGGMRLYPGPSWGGPPSFDLAGPGVTVGPKTLMERALRQAPAWTQATFDPDRDIPPIQAELGPILNSYDPDLSAFQRSGGKLILYHGWADALITPENTLHYYEQVEATVGGDVRTFARLFMAPGMDHCYGGRGPFAFDGLAALVDWVEQGRAPDQIIAAHLTNNVADRTRPLCPWPKVARYRGAGSIDEAASFACAAPS